MLSAGGTLELFYWLRVAALAGMVALAVVRARRRWLGSAEADTSRRILLPWIAMITGYAIYLGAFTILLAPFLIFSVVATVALWVAVPSIVSILAIDFGARLLEAERTGFWLGAGIVAYLAFTFIWLGLFGIGPLLFLPEAWLEVLLLSSVPVMAALIWWSYLPGGGGGDAVARTFD